MHRFGRTFLVVLVLALATATPGCGGDDNEAGGGETTTAAMGPTKVRLAFSTWNGYLALVVGVKEGFFKNHGADVSYSVIEDPVQRFNAFKAGRLDAIASTTDRRSASAPARSVSGSWRTSSTSTGSRSTTSSRST